ncbi:YitT family protein [Effusibacillus pohliae]|uniref:YitT family protein n=1 Tax=Effusibacillus pohliae TaxID=232270 RepID=UPI00037EA9C4|nr:YitT family protein [Effusibacillus pohliae]
MRELKNWISILAGSAILSFGINNFIIQNQLAEGGFFGISLLLLYAFHLKFGYSFLLLNVPLFYIGYRMFGRRFLVKTFAGVALVSLFSLVIPENITPPLPNDKLLAALYGGVVNGIGLGLIFRSGATTGGSDIIARIVNYKWGYSIGRTLFAIDILVISIIAVLQGMMIAMYSLVALFIAAKVIDVVIEGVATSKSAMIISDRTHEIAKAIHDQLERGTTLLKGRGGYTGQDKEVLYCVVSREEIIKVQQIVHDIDPQAFVIVTDVHDVLGEGFSPLVKQPE